MADHQPLLEQLKVVFFEEADEGLAVMESGLLELDPGSADSEAINGIFRAAHSIKGGAGTFGFAGISSFTHGMETLLDQIRSGQAQLTSPRIKALLHAVDHLRLLVEAARSGGKVDETRTDAVRKEIEREIEGHHTKVVPAVVATPGPDARPNVWSIIFEPNPAMMRSGNDPYLLLRELSSLGRATIEVDSTRLPPLEAFDPELIYLSWRIHLEGPRDEKTIREVFAWVEDECRLVIERQAAAPEVVVAVAPAQTNPTTPRPPQDPPVEQERRKTDLGSIRVSIDKVDALVNMVGELVITQSMLGQIERNFDLGKLSRLRDGLNQLERNTRELQESVMRIRMLPIRFIFSRFPRMVRDLSDQLGKDVELTMLGEGTELDKTVLEKLGDPLVHLVRNSVDHGVELPEQRRAAGKPGRGTITLEAFHQGSSIVIEIRDDGGGLKTDRILAKARAAGLIAADVQPNPEEINDLIFSPGLSTADKISDVSGRGVGLDVVRRNIRELGGNVSVSSELGRGTTFTIRLPLTLAILDGQLIKVGDQTYILPLVSIVESIAMRPDQINAIAGRAEMYRLRDEYLPILRLHQTFGLAGGSQDHAGRLLVVVEGNGQRLGITVDDLLEQQQVVIKSLDTNFRRVDGVSGATILGDGTVALILDVAGLIAFAKGEGKKCSTTPTSSGRPWEAPQRRVDNI